MKLLVDHGYSNNLGDIAMVEAAVLRLRADLPEAEIFVIEKPKFKSIVWDLPMVYRHEGYGVRPFLQSKFKNVPLLQHYNKQWRKMTCKFTIKLVEIFLSASSISLPKKKDFGRITLGEYCKQFDALHLVGGGFLTDTFYEELFRKYLLILTFAQQNKPVIFT